MDLTPLEALRALGITDDEIRARAKWLGVTIEEYEKWAEEATSEGETGRHNPVDRLNAAILCAAEQLGPERVPVTRETPLGTKVHRGEGAYVLIGWDGDFIVVDPIVPGVGGGYYVAHEADGWYVVVEGDR